MFAHSKENKNIQVEKLIEQLVDKLIKIQENPDNIEIRSYALFCSQIHVFLNNYHYNLKDHNSPRVYSPAIQQKIMDELDKTRQLLQEHGFPTEIIRAFDTAKENALKECHISSKKRMSPHEQKKVDLEDKAAVLKSQNPFEVKTEMIEKKKSTETFSFGFLSAGIRYVPKQQSVCVHLAPSGQICISDQSMIAVINNNQIKKRKNIEENFDSCDDFIARADMIAHIKKDRRCTDFYNSHLELIASVPAEITNFIPLSDNKIIFQVDILDATSDWSMSKLVLHDLVSYKRLAECSTLGDGYCKINDLKSIASNQFIAINESEIEFIELKDNKFVSTKKIKYKLSTDSSKKKKGITKINLSPEKNTLVLLDREGRSLYFVNIEVLLSHPSNEWFDLSSQVYVPLPYCMKEFAILSEESLLTVDLDDQLFHFHFESLSNVIMSQTTMPKELARMIAAYVESDVEREELPVTKTEVLCPSLRKRKT